MPKPRQEKVQPCIKIQRVAYLLKIFLGSEDDLKIIISTIYGGAGVHDTLLFSFKSSQQCKNVTIPILQVRRLKFREAKCHAVHPLARERGKPGSVKSAVPDSIRKYGVI